MIKLYLTLFFNLVILSTGLYGGWQARGFYEQTPIPKLVAGKLTW